MENPMYTVVCMNLAKNCASQMAHVLAKFAIKTSVIKNMANALFKEKFLAIPIIIAKVFTAKSLLPKCF